MNNVKKIDVRVKRTYKNLIDGISKLLTEKSFEDISVLEICDISGVHRATFYKHFTDKYDFLSFCLKSMINELPFESLPKDLAKESSRQGYFDFMSVVINFVDLNRTLFKNIYTGSSSNVFAALLTEAVANTFEERIRIKIDEGAKFYSPAPILANFYAGALVGVLKWWTVEGDNYSAADIEKFIFARIDDIHSNYTKKTAIK